MAESELTESKKRVFTGAGAVEMESVVEEKTDIVLIHR